MAEFFICAAQNCNRKYKTYNKFKEHMMKEHEQLVPDQQEVKAVAINKNNKKEVNAEKEKVAAKKSLQELEAELKKKKELEAQIKLEEEAKHLAQHRDLCALFCRAK
jgi:hypothetical protein